MKENKQKPKAQQEKEKTIVATRKRTFKGKIIKIFPTRVVIESEQTIYLPKFERYYKKKSKLHARIQKHMSLGIGDIIEIQECRPLSKIIHFVVKGIIKKAEAPKEDKK